MQSTGTSFLEKQDLNLFTGAHSSIEEASQLLDRINSSFILASDPDDLNKELTLLNYSLKTLKHNLLFRKDTTFYGLGLDLKINQLITHIDGFDISTVSPQTVSQFDTIRTSLRSAIGALKSAGQDLPLRYVLTDILYFDYARFGENSLNQEVGRLGDALVLLSEVSKELNRIESTLAINPGKRFLNERGELMITDNASNGTTATNISLYSNGNSHFFYHTTPFKSVERKYVDGTLNTLSAIDVIKDAVTRLEELLNQVPANSDQHTAITKIISIAKTEYNVLGLNSGLDISWADREGGNSNDGELYWKTNYEPTIVQPKNFIRLYMDSEFRKSITDALSVVQSQNDIQKQILSKSLFLYQEFIKSSASLIDMTFKCTKSVAQKIAR